MENLAQELQDLAQGQTVINPEATGTKPESSASDKKPESDKRSMKDSVYHYAQVTYTKTISLLDTVLNWSGELLIATAATAAFAILGIFAVQKLGVGLIAGLAIILGVGLLCKYTSGIVGGRGFNPLRNFA